MVHRIRLLLTITLGLMVLAACGTTPPPATTFELDVTLAGTGTGTVVSDPAGIDTAAGDFTAEFDEGTEVTLTATAGADSTFTAWSGDCTGATCTVTMDAAKSVTATFTEDEVPVETETLTVAIVNGGTADVSVTSNPAGIDAGNLSAEFEIGATVVLTADAGTGGFYGWQGGDCDGLDTVTCSVTIGAGEPAVTALFNDVTTLTVKVGNSGTFLNADDAEEFLADSFNAGNTGQWDEGFSYRSSSDLELGFDPEYAPQAVGLRFRDVSLPDGAKVLSTVIGFTAYANPDAGSAGTVNLTITGEAVDSADLFITDAEPNLSFDITSRARTTASVAWAISGAWTGETVYNSADVTEILLEILARPGWADGNPMVFILEPDAIESTEYRRAYAHDADPAKAATLTVSYITMPALP